MLIRRPGLGNAHPEDDCKLGDASTTGLRILEFEELFLWATHDGGSTESVWDMFGGVDALHYSVDRRSKRLACLHAREYSGEAASEHGRRDKRRRDASKRYLGKTRRDIAEDHVFTCLEEHLNTYPDDVRAAFALDMMIKASSGRQRMKKRASRLRDTALARTGLAGQELWGRLHTQAAIAVATPAR